MTSRRRALAGVVALTLAGQGASILYEISVADRFGTGVDADALALTFTMVVAVANEIVMWISTLFIPYYVERSATAGPGAAAGVLRRSLLAVAMGTAALAFTFVLAASSLVGLLAPDPLVRGPSGHLARLFAPLLVLLPLSALLAGALQAQGRFAVSGLRQVCWYGMALLFLLTLGPRLGSSTVPLGMGTGLALFCAILGGTLWSFGALTSSSLEPAGHDGSRGRRLGAALLPLALASAANYVNVSIERGIAARLPEGSLAALTYAFRLLHFPVNLFLVNATTVLFPSLAVHAAREEYEALEGLILRALRLTLIFTVPLAVLSMALAQPAIQVVLQRGAFTADSTRLTATALTLYAPGLVGIAGTQVLVRAYQALREIRRLVVIGVAVIALNIALMLTLTRAVGFPGLPAAMSVSSIILFAAMLLGLRRRLPGLDLRGVGASAWRVTLAAAVAAGCAHVLTVPGPESALLALMVGGGAGMASFGLALFWLSRADAYLALAFVFPRLGRLAAGRH
jgi:putative peptidoglycan lipid II flippase